MTMDRRSFLKVLASLGVAVTLPANWAAAAPAEIHRAWDAASSRWRLFEVDAYGTLSYANFEEPTTRREAYDLPPAAAIGADDIEDFEPLARHVERYFDDLVEADEEKLIASGIDPDRGWREWYESAGTDAHADVARSIDAWLDDRPAGNEWEFYYTSGNAQGAAFYALQHEAREVLDALSIKIIEGDHPGSTYYAAELRIAPAEANRIAKRLGLEMRFVREDGAT
jgi:hypothetical protein